MLPRKISFWWLLIAWVLFTIPHVVISFNWTLPIYSSKAKEINGLISNWSLTFSTSLLFWMIVEWLLDLKKSRAAAVVQRRFLDRTIGMLNFLVRSISGDLQKGGLTDPDYFHKGEWEAKINEFLNGKDTNEMLRQVREGMPKLHYIGHRTVIQQQFQMILPYCGDFSSDFTNVLTSLVDEFLDETRYGKKDEQEYITLLRLYIRFGDNLESLEAWYIRDHGFPKKHIAERLKRWPYAGKPPKEYR